MAFLNSGQACAAGTRLLVPGVAELHDGHPGDDEILSVGDPPILKSLLDRRCAKSA
jgi:hypothetical protein